MASDFAAYEAPITEDALRALIDAAPDRALVIYVVHYEDKYETVLGDGMYFYFAWAYRDKAAAEQACAAFTEGFASYTAGPNHLTYDPEDGGFSAPVYAAALIGDWQSDY
jgi:hypothetical protein